MAVKVATKITLSIKELFNALVAKTTPLYAGKDNWGKYNYEEVIYPQARAAFKDLYPTSLYPTTEEFLNRFKRDYYKKDKALQKIVNKGEHGQENEIVFNQSTEATAETPISGTPTGEPAQTMAGGFPHLPSSGSGPQAPRVRFIQSQPISTPVTDKAERFAQENPATAKINRLNQPASTQTPSIQTGRKTEIPKVFEDAFKNEPKYKTDPGVSAPQSPHITKPTPLTQPNILPPKRINFSAIKLPSSVVNTAKGFSSKAGVFFQRNIGKHLTAGRIATFASSGIGAVAGAGFGGMGMVGGGIAGAAFPSWVRSGGAGKFLGKVGNGAINAFSGLSNQVTSGITGGKSGLKKFGRNKWIIGILLFVIGFGAIASLGGGTPDGTTPGGNVGVGPTAPIPPSGSHPTAPTVDPSGLRQKIIDQFGITMNGYDPDHLRWAWEKLWEVSATKFVSLVRGSAIQARTASAQVGCPGVSVAVYLDQYPETLFKYGFIHELGHVIRNCTAISRSFNTEHANALTRERGVTYYANNAPSCTGSDNPSEDYAEMIALYLSPSANIQMTRCTPAGTKYTDLRTEFPLHYNVARSILGDF